MTAASSIIWVDRAPLTPIRGDFMTDAVARVRARALGHPAPRSDAATPRRMGGASLYEEWHAYADRGAIYESHLAAIPPAKVQRSKPASTSRRPANASHISNPKCVIANRPKHQR